MLLGYIGNPTQSIRGIRRNAPIFTLRSKHKLSNINVRSNPSIRREETSRSIASSSTFHSKSLAISSNRTSWNGNISFSHSFDAVNSPSSLRINWNEKRLYSTSKSEGETKGEGPLGRWQKLVDEGKIRKDEHQRKIVEKLETVYHRIVSYDPSVINKNKKSKGLFDRFWKKKETEEEKYQFSEEIPKGVYLWGDVGCGKTFLMDLLYDACANHPRVKAKRVHFHQFMIDFHEKLHQNRMKQEDLGDPIPPIAEEFARDAWFLCFDEFQVTDVANAAILNRLFSALFHNGVVVVMTSNRIPSDLYKNGLKRELFLPFIDLLCARNEVLCLNSGIDYRLAGTMSKRIFNYPINKETTSILDELFHKLSHGEKPTSQVLEVASGRTLNVKNCARGVARFTFHELCDKPLGSADYIAISKNFHTVIMDGIPVLNAYTQLNQARRLIHFVDELYNYRVKFICSAEDSPKNLLSLVDDGPQIKGSKPKFTRNQQEEEEYFMWSRLVSRLTEMQSDEYLESAHNVAEKKEENTK